MLIAPRSIDNRACPPSEFVLPAGGRGASTSVGADTLRFVRSARSRRLGALAFAALMGASCSSSSASRNSASSVVDRSSSLPGTTAAAPSTTLRTTTTTTLPVRGPVTIAFGGDVHFEGVLRSKLAADPDHVLDAIAPVLRGADIAMVNLETAITERGSPEPKKYTFRASPAAFQALRAGGVDVVTMANNHGVDFGPVGLADSLAAIRTSGFPVVGIGADATRAYAPYRLVVHGERIAIIGATQVIDGALIPTWTATATNGGVASAKEVDRLVAAVRAARRMSDTVVVYLHWGIEQTTCPSADQQRLAATLAVAGADVIVGSHAHRRLGAGRLGDAFVDYGLGNFAFYTSSGPGLDTGVLTITVTSRHVNRYEWTPAEIHGGTPQPLSGSEGERAVADWSSLRDCTGLAP